MVDSFVGWVWHKLVWARGAISAISLVAILDSLFGWDRWEFLRLVSAMLDQWRRPIDLFFEWLLKFMPFIPPPSDAAKASFVIAVCILPIPLSELFQPEKAYLAFLRRQRRRVEKFLRRESRSLKESLGEYEERIKSDVELIEIAREIEWAEAANRTEVNQKLSRTERVSLPLTFVFFVMFFGVWPWILEAVIYGLAQFDPLETRGNIGVVRVIVNWVNPVIVIVVLAAVGAVLFTRIDKQSLASAYFDSFRYVLSAIFGFVLLLCVPTVRVFLENLVLDSSF